MMYFSAYLSPASKPALNGRVSWGAPRDLWPRGLESNQGDGPSALAGVWPSGPPGPPRGVFQESKASRSFSSIEEMSSVRTSM